MPATIRVLPEAVRSRIAAGEVIERPASVVKELVENSLDAGAARVDVEFSAGGLPLIVVADDGAGMSSEDLALCAERHATSKLSDAEDIYRISTLGFRGEALPSIGSVSRMRIASRRRGAPPEAPAFAIEVVGGVKGEVVPCALAAGTRVEVRDLFFSTPVRARFLKSEAAEAAAIAETATRLALSRPDVAFALSRDGREMLRTPGNSSLDDVIAACFGMDFAAGLLPARVEGPAGTVLEGFASKPSFHKPNRAGIHFFVNGRAVRDRFLASALEEAYRGLLPPRRHPAAFLRLEIEPSEVDVNIHPTKAEVKFRNPGLIFAMIQSAIRNMLAPAPPRPAAPGNSEGVRRDGLPPEDADRRPWEALGRPERKGAGGGGGNSRPATLPVEARERRTFDLWVGERVVGHSHSLASEAAPRYQAVAFHPASGRTAVSPPDGSAGIAPDRTAGGGPDRTGSAHQAQEERRDGPLSQGRGGGGAGGLVPVTAGDFRVVGQAGGAYIVFEDEEGLCVADQHALHERILFERFRRRVEEGGGWEVQGLLLPVTVEVSPEAAAMLPEATGLLGALGFDIEPFGPRSLAVRGIPSAMGNAEDAGPFLVEVIEKFASGLRTDRAALREKVLAMMACKAATKAGERLTEAQMRALVAEYRALVSSRGFTCPHGRSVAVELSWEELERKVGR
ncbi:MAG: DNA mismatch repair endonuclease MutL [Planctomycetota bacterium]|nr:DNA mismatch repair endonuclease MutL [Planctomycetota bacterium]